MQSNLPSEQGIQGGLTADDLNGSDEIELNVSPDSTDAEYHDLVTKLDQSKVVLTSIEDNVKRVFDMQDVADVVLAQESICFEDIVNVATVFPEVYDEVSPKETYTAAPTKTNLEETANYVSSKLEEEKLSLVASQKAYILETLTDASQVYAWLSERAIPEVLERLETIRTLALKELPLVINSNSFLMYQEEKSAEMKTLPELIDLRYRSLRYIDYEGSNPGESLLPSDLREEAVRLSEIIANTWTKSFIKNISSVSKDTIDFLHRSWHAEGISTSEGGNFPKVSYLDLLKLVSTDEFKNTLSKMGDDLTTIQKAAMTVTEPFVNSEETSAMLAVTRSSAEAISDYYELLSALSNHVWNLKMFCNSAENVIRLFKAFRIDVEAKS